MSANVTLFGNVVRDPELRYSQAGKAWSSFSIAVNHRKKKGDDYEEITSFYDVVCFGDMAEHAAASLAKGQRVMVVGQLDMEKYEDKKTGEMRTAAKVAADEIGVSLRFGTTEYSRSNKGEAF